MKRFVYFLAFIAIFTGCQKANTPVEWPEEDSSQGSISPDSTYVSFRPEFEFGEEPLTRAGNNDLYIVAVSQISPYEGWEGSHNIRFLNHAWGYFDNLDLAVFKLFKKSKYSFVVVYIPDGKNTIYKYSDGTYGAPFSGWASGGDRKPINTIFYDDPYSNWPTLDRGVARAKNSNSDKLWTNVVRYQGIVERFDPSQSDIVRVKLYQMMIGFRITIDDFTEGYVEVSGQEENDGRAEFYRVYPSKTSTTNILDFEVEMSTMPMWGFFRGFGAGNELYDADDYMTYSSEELEARVLENINNEPGGQIHIRYYDDEGSSIPVFSKYLFEYKRNTRYTLRFSLSDAIANGGIVPEVTDDGEMTEAVIPL